MEMADRDTGEESAKPTDTEGRFSFSTIYEYLRSHKYPRGASKLEKISLRRRAKYFRVHDEDLYYLGGGNATII